MPKQKGIIKFHGTLNGISFYPLNGEYICRIANGPSKKRINTDPAFANVKANNLEFGMASKWSKAIRTGFLETANQFQDPKMSGRLTGVCRKIIQEGSGPLGKREAKLANNPEAIIGFQLNQKQAFNQIYTAKPIVTTYKNRRTITISIPESTKNHLNKQPKTATHFQLTAALSIVSNYKYFPYIKAYKPVAPKHNALGCSQNTGPLLCKIDHTNLQIKLKTPVNMPVSKHASLVVWLGIQFLKKEGTQYYPLKNMQVMQAIHLL